MRYAIYASWAGTVFALVGASLIAANINAVLPAYFILLTSGILWICAASHTRDWAQITMQIGFCTINIVGIIRWWSA